MQTLSVSSMNYSNQGFTHVTNFRSSKIIKEESFEKKLQLAKNTDEFRIVAKLTDSSILPVLEQFGKELHIFNSYEGIAITLTKEKIFLFLKENYFLEIWNNVFKIFN
ncbi:MAG: hypothetical protein ACTSRO_04795 [Candidatus Heimdallarchaeaceae archaeon]